METTNLVPRVGKDIHGNDIHIGDKVRVVAASSSSLNGIEYIVRFVGEIKEPKYGLAMGVKNSIWSEDNVFESRTKKWNGKIIEKSVKNENLVYLEGIKLKVIKKSVEPNWYIEK